MVSVSVSSEIGVVTPEADDVREWRCVPFPGSLLIGPLLVRRIKGIAGILLWMELGRSESMTEPALQFCLSTLSSTVDIDVAVVRLLGDDGMDINGG
jgi:hypothetical protein